VIQRIQSLLLILAVATNVGFFFTPLFDHILRDPTGWISAVNISALLFASGLSLFSIFKFNDRAKQIYWVKIALFFQVVGVASAIGVLLSLGGIGTYLLEEALSFALITIAILLQYLAIHFIHKDEKLVKSMDRIR
jgi:type III secretory pathway component EscS